MTWPADSPAMYTRSSSAAYSAMMRAVIRRSTPAHWQVVSTRLPTRRSRGRSRPGGVGAWSRDERAGDRVAGVDGRAGVVGVGVAGVEVLTEIENAATFAAKLGGAGPAAGDPVVCNAPLAREGLRVEPDLGLLLPCTVWSRSMTMGPVRHRLSRRHRQDHGHRGRLDDACCGCIRRPCQSRSGRFSPRSTSASPSR
jgi:hypothetical protein